MLSGSTKFAFDENSKILTVQNGNFKTTAKVFDTVGYDLHAFDDAYQGFGSIESDTLLNILKASIASSKEEDQTREFTGTLLDIANGKFNCVATNKSRLFWINQETQLSESLYCLLERDSVALLNRTLKSGITVDLHYKKVEDNVTQVMFMFGDSILLAKTIVGRLPKYQEIFIDKLENVTKITVDKKLLKNALNRIMILVGNDETSAIELKISDKILLSATNAEGELAEDVIECKETTQPIEFKIRGKYALDFLDNSDGDDVCIYCTSPTKPIEFKTEKDGVEYLYITAPAL
jgi:DNA polymerase-3 subunit beta